MRLIDGELYTAIHRYIHIETGRRVTVIGTWPFAESDYWGELQALIDSLTAGGSVVHCQGSRLLTGDGETATADEWDLVADLGSYDEMEYRRITDLGWVSRADGLAYPPRWQLVDLSYLEILRRVGPAPIRKILNRRARMNHWSDERWRLAATASMRFLDNNHVIARSGRNPLDALVRSDRYAVALRGVDRTERDTVMVWGVAHLPALGAGLRERRFYRLDETEWHTAVTGISLRSALRQWISPRSRSASTP